jgi:periplasmic divalent cation tolerance protein
MSDGPCQVSVACGSPEEAERIADALLSARLAACVQNLGPMTSRYWWKGEREAAAEWLLVAKTRVARLDDLVAAVRTIHSYETPEIVATPIIGGDSDYLAWLDAEASGSS